MRALTRASASPSRFCPHLSLLASASCALNPTPQILSDGDAYIFLSHFYHYTAENYETYLYKFTVSSL